MNPSTKRSILFMAISAILAMSAHGQVPLPLGGPISQWCKTAINKDICTKQLNGATAWHDAVKNALDATEKNNVEFQKLLPDVINAIKGPSKSIIAKVCKEDFSNIASNIKDAKKFFAENDSRSASSYLSSSDIIDCQESFTSSGSEMPPSVSKAFDELFLHIDNTLAVINKN